MLDADKLTDWESLFIGEMEDIVKASGGLSEKQEEILERIFKEKQ